MTLTNKIKREFRYQVNEFRWEFFRLKSDLIRWYNKEIRHNKPLNRYEEFDEVIKTLAVIKELRVY